jgi:hypothetical protein
MLGAFVQTRVRDPVVTESTHPLTRHHPTRGHRRRIPRKSPLFGYTNSLDIVPGEFAALGRVDQKAWLWLKGAEWASVVGRVYEESADEPAKVGEIETRLVRSRMSMHADVGYDSPNPSPLRVDFRPPEAWLPV